MPRPPRYTGAPVLVRMTPEARAELDRLARAYDVPATEVARLAIELGLGHARVQLAARYYRPGEGPHHEQDDDLSD